MSACILWTGAFHEGYPMLANRRAHRMAYEEAHGPIPRGHIVHHSTCFFKPVPVAGPKEGE